MPRIATIISAFLFASTLSANAATVTLFEDTFASDVAHGAGYVTVTELANWTVTAGNVDILGPGYGCTGCIDLDGSGSSAPAVLQTRNAVRFLVGVTYTFKLFFSGGSANEFVSMGPEGYVQIGDFAGTGPSVVEFLYSFATNETRKLNLFTSGPVDNFGPYLDRVLITYDVAAVPLPAAAPLLLLGLGALGMLRRRRA